jgi:hypothetical protein|tara:strand:+ start:4008 stop:4394 length:387 start_codon:yes stop_codon:yes gene_type:complete
MEVTLHLRLDKKINKDELKKFKFEIRKRRPKEVKITSWIKYRIEEETVDGKAVPIKLDVDKLNTFRKYTGGKMVVLEKVVERYIIYFTIKVENKDILMDYIIEVNEIEGVDRFLVEVPKKEDRSMVFE